jgi:zinc protease
MKVVILPKKTTGSMVEGAIELRFGDASTLAGKNTAAQFAGSMLTMGTKSKSRQQLQDEIRKLNAQIQVSGGGGGGFGGRGGGGRGGFGGGGGVSSVTASIMAPPENFVAAMRLAVEMLEHPAYPDADFDRMLTARIKTLEAIPTEPTQLAAETLQRHLTPWSKGDVLYPSTREDQLAEMKKLTLADVKKFHDQYYGANYGVFVVVGPVEAEAVKKAAAELLGKWNTALVYKPITAAFKKVEPVNRRIDTPDKANAQFEAGMRVQLSENDPDYPAMLLAGYMFGGPITSRVSDRIRNREGLSYGANARIAVPSEGDAAMLSGTVSLNPVNGPKVEASFQDELAKTLKEGFTDAEVAKAKQAFLDARMVARSSDAGLLSQLATHEQLGRTMKWDEQVEQRIRALTAAQVNAAFRKHVDAAALTIVKAGDWKAAGVYQ